MTDPAESGDAEPAGDVDFGWVMATTFVVTILAGAPLVALGAVFVELPTWGDRASFAVRVGAVVWFGVAVGTYLYDRSRA